MTKAEAEERALNYGWCRGVTHFWSPNGPVKVTKRGYEMKLVCKTCHTTRTTVMNRNGTLKVGSIYHWPGDYLIKTRSGKAVKKSDVRRMMFIEGRSGE